MSELLTQIREFEDSAVSRLNSVTQKAELDALKIEFLGRKGKLTEFSKQIGKVPADLRPKIGAEINRLKKVIQDTIEIQVALSHKLIKKEFLDYTLPVRADFIGHKHPLLQTVDDIISIFHGMGFEVAYGPDVETDYYTFDALNTPEDHPSRDLSDTFYIKKGVCLRTFLLWWILHQIGD